jgi:CubicO group peptidase (beta-lactamase class C family)
MKPATLFLILLLGGLTSCAQSTAQSTAQNAARNTARNTAQNAAPGTADTLARVDSLFRSFTPAGPGCAVSIIRDGKVIFEKGYGTANLEYDIPIGTRTVFDLASVSKQFTGYAISTLIQQGKISPDDDVHRYLPDLPQLGYPISIRNLIHHTSGLRDWPETLHAAGWRWDDVFAFSDILRMVKEQRELDFAPGSQYSYSNTGYNMLAEIVRKVTNQSLRQWEAENIFKPLGMNSTVVMEDYSWIIKQRAVSYYPDGNTYKVAMGGLVAYGSSSIFSSIEDLNKWVIFFTKGLRSKDPVVTRMLECDTLSDKKKVDYGYGLVVRPYKGVNTISHDGGWQGYRTLILHFPDDQLSLVLLSNYGFFNTADYGYRIAHLFLGDKLQPDPPRENLSSLPTVTVDTALARKYTGTFQLGPGWYVTFTMEKGLLMVQANGEDRFSMQPKSDSVYWVPGYGSAFHFIKNEKGAFNEVKYRTILAPRIAALLPDTSQLSQYAGSYYSTELETGYRLSVVNHQLTLHHMRLGDLSLAPDIAKRDQFSGDVGTLTFTRNPAGVISGFTLSGGRMKHMRFLKQE